MKKSFVPLFLALLFVCTCMADNSSADDLGKGLQRELQESRSLVVQAEEQLRAGLAPTVEIARLKVVAETIRASHLLMEERFRERENKVAVLGGKAVDRHDAVASQYRRSIEKYLALVDALPPDGNLTQSTFDEFKKLLNKITLPKKRPLLGTLPYKYLGYPAREPATSPVVLPAYKGGDRSVTPSDTAGSTEAPISEEIADHARSLQWNPVLIYEWVKNNVATEWYWGVMKGAEETLRQKSGNDADQAALLVALLRASGYPTRFVRGTIEFFPDIDKVKNLTGIDEPMQIAAFFQKAGIPFKPVIAGGRIANFQVEHIWVETFIPYSNYRGAVLDDMGKSWLGLDTSVKSAGYASNHSLDLPPEITASLRDDYLQGVKTSTPLEYFKTRAEEYLRGNYPGKTYQDLLSVRTIIPDILKIIPASLQFKPVNIIGEYTTLPAELTHKATFTATGPGNSELFSITLPVMQLSNRQVVLSYEPETVEDQQIIDNYGGLDNTPSYLVRLRPVLKVNGERLVVAGEGLAMGAEYALAIDVVSPNGMERIGNTHFIGNLAVIGVVSQSSMTDVKIQDEDDAANILFKEAHSYIQRWTGGENELASLLKLAISRPIPTIVTVGGLVDVTYLLDTPYGFDWKGLFIDAALRGIETVTRTGDNSREKTFMRLSALQGSILENRVFEDDLKVDSISTAKLLQLAAGSGTPLVTVDKSNVDVLLPALTLDENIKTDIRNAVNQNQNVKIPGSEITYRDWTGIGYVKEDPDTGESGWMLSGMVAGGTTALVSSYWNDSVSRLVADRLQFPFAGTPNTDPASAVYIRKVSSTDMQQGIVGLAIGKPLQVMVLDAQKRPVKGANVVFSVIAGGGTLADNAESVTVKTDLRGIASVGYTLGKHTGDNPTYWLETGKTYSTQISENLINAVLPNGESIPAPFTAYGFPGEAHHIKRKGSGTQSDAVLSFAGPAIVVVEDRYDNPVANRSVVFEVLEPTNVGACYSVPQAKPLSLIAAGDPCLNKIPVYGECGVTPLLTTTQLTGYDGAASAGVLLGGIPGASYSIKATDSGIQVSSSDPTIVNSVSIPYATFPFGNPCGMANDPANWLIATYTYPIDVDGNNINAAKAGTAMPLQARAYAVREGAVNTTVNGPCGTVCNKIAGSGTFSNFTGFTSSSLTFTGPDNVPIAGIPQDTAAQNGTYTGSYLVSPGINNIAVRAEATMMRDRTEVCPSCTTISGEEFSLAAETSIVVYGVDIATTPSVEIQVDQEGYSTGNAVINYTIAPPEYQAGRADVVIYESENGKGFQPILYIPAETRGEGSAKILRGFPFDLKKTYKAEVVLNNGSGVEIKSSEIPINLIGGNFVLERQHLLSQFDSTIPTTIGSAYTDSYKTFSVTLPQQSSVTVSVLNGEFNALGTIVPTTSLPAGEYNFVVDYGQVRNIGVDPSVSPAFYLQVLQTPSDGPPHKTIYRGRLSERTHGKMLGQTIVHDVMLQDGSLNLSRQDFAFNGRGPQLAFTRSYSNQASPAGIKPFGEGWGHSLDRRLQPVSSQASGAAPVPEWVTNLKGRLVNPENISQTPLGWTVVYVNDATFKKVNNVWYAERGRHGSLTEENGLFIFTAKDGTRYKYDYPLHEPTPVRTIEDRNGNVMTFAYDAVGRLAMTTDAVGRSCSFRYEALPYIYSDSNSRLADVSCSGGIEIEFSYNAEGYLRSVRRGDRIEIYDYAREPGIVKADYNLVKATDSNNNSYQYQYFGRGEVDANLVNFIKYFRAQDVVKNVIYPDGATASFKYEVQAGNRRTVTDMRGNGTIYTLNFHGNPQKIEEPLGKTTLMTWSIDEGKNDNVMTSRTDPRGNTTSYQYDSQGNVIKETDPYGNSVSTVWNMKYSLPESRIDRNGVTLGWQYDLKGNLLRETDGDGKQTGHTYYPTGERKTTTDPRGSVTTYVYDQWGNPGAVTQAEGSVTKYEHDIRGRRTALIDPNARRTEYAYDDLDYPTTTAFPKHESYPLADGSSRVRSTLYDSVGNLISETDRLGLTLTYTYTPRNQVKTVSRSVGGTKTFDYDPNGNPLSETDWKGIATTHVYDALNRRVTTNNRLGFPRQMGYDPNGNLTSETDEEGRATSHEYDKLNRLTRTVQPALSGQLAGELVFDYYNEADPKTNLKSETDQEGNTTAYEYNGRYLRTKRTNALLDIHLWEYDDADNLTKETDEENRSVRHEYDGQNRLVADIRSHNGSDISTTFAYDPAGNRIKLTDPLGRVTTTEYDEWNRPWQIIDPENFTSASELDGEGNKVRTIDANGGTRTWTRDQHGLVLNAVDAEGNETRYAYDLNGNTETVTFANDLVTRIAYDAEDRKLLTTEAFGEPEERATGVILYDKVGNALQVKDGNGNITTTEYNALNLPIKVTDAGGKFITSDYYRTGKVKSVTNRRGFATATEYDKLWRVTKVTDPLLKTVETTYDKAGNVRTVKDKRGIVAEMLYDDLYRPVEKKRASVRLVSYEYNDAGNITAEIDANGNRTEHAYTKRNQKQKTTFADAATRSYGYDGNGNLKTETDEEGIVTTYGYDHENRPTTTERAGEETRKLYDAMGNLAAVIRPKGNSRGYGYDKLNRLISATDDQFGINLVTAYTYDKNDNRVKTTDPRGNITDNGYDELNRKTSETRRKADGDLVTAYGYDEEGNLTSLTDPKGQVSTYVYDELNRKTAASYSGLSITYAYDENNNEVSSSVSGTSSDSTTSTYDDFDRLKSSTQRGITVSYSYDANGNRLSVGMPTSSTAYDYDQRNRVKTASALLSAGATAGAQLTTFDYYPDGKRKTVSYPNGGKEEYQYFPTNRIKSLTNSVTGATISRFAYSYDPNGNRLTQDEQRGERTITTTYGYDTLDRMSNYTVTDNGPATETAYTYNGYNRATESVVRSGAFTIKRYNYDETDWLTHITDGTKIITYTYDNNGNTTQKTDSTDPDNPITYAYDARDKLTSAAKGSNSLGTYSYNADGYRIRQNNSDRGDVEYYYDGTAVIEERNASGLLAHYRYANKLMSLSTPTGSQYYHHDALGSTTDLTDDSGAAKTSYFLNPWGMIVESLGSSVNRRVFTGKEIDENTGLIYFGARYYDPVTGRFTTEDSYLGEEATPPSLHRYLYAYSNPTVFIDLEGCLSWDEVKAGWDKAKTGAKDAWTGIKTAGKAGWKILPDVTKKGFAGFDKALDTAYETALQNNLPAVNNPLAQAVLTGGITATKTMLGMGSYPLVKASQLSEYSEEPSKIQNFPLYASGVRDTYNASKAFAQDPSLDNGAQVVIAGAGTFLETAGISYGTKAIADSYSGTGPKSGITVESPNLNKVATISHGNRPDPTSYLPQAYIDSHLLQFEKGASYLTPKAALDRWGRGMLGRADGQFVMPSGQLDKVLLKTKGDMALVEKELGIPVGEWQGRELVRIDIPNPNSLNLRMPSGNEAGANPLWRPGGKLSTGYSEAVVDQIPKDSYSELSISEALRRLRE